MTRRIFTALFFYVSFFYLADAQTIRPFKAGDRVVFVGNSITDGGHYHSYIWLYYMTHFPTMRLTCYNAGIGGDAIGQIANRFDDDVLSKNPTLLTLTWGMNDTGYFEWFKSDAQDFMDKRLEGSFKVYTQLENKLKSRTDIEKVIILGSPYDETTKSNPKNLYPKKSVAFARVIDFQEEAAKRNGWGFVDFNHPMLEIEKREQAKDSLFSLAPNDRIHPDNDGHLVMAYLFLKAQGLANQVVADMAINAGNNKVTHQMNCRVSNITGDSKVLSFDYLANSLPYPIDTIPRGWGNKKKQSEALKVVPFIQEFNQELLTVKGLKEGNYRLKIDGENIGQWPAKQFSDGINLAEEVRTPQYQQAITVRELNEERWDIERRIREYTWMEWDFLYDKKMLYADNADAMDTIKKAALKNPFVNGNMDNFTRGRFKAVRDAWQKEMDVLVNEIYAINTPVKRKIEIEAIN
jgi:lysophospholipase L1-like esterase